MASSWQRTVAVMFLAQLLASLGFSTVFPFLPAYVEELGSSTGGSTVFWVAMVYSVQAVAMAIASPVWGALADRYGRKPMVIRSLIGGAAFVVLMGFARSAEELVLIRLFQGIVTGVVSASASLVAASVPRERLGYAMGLMQTGQWAGISVGPILGGLLEFLVGIRMSFVVTGVVLTIGGLLVIFGVRERFTPPERKDHLVRDMFGQWGTVLRAPGVRFAYLLRFTAWLGRTMIMPYLPLFIATLTMRDELSSLYTGIAIGAASFAGTISGVTLGRLGDKVGHKRVLVASALATAVFYAPMSLVTGVWQLVLLNVVVGFAVGGVLPAVSAMLARLTDPAMSGSVYGLDNSVGAASRAFAPLLAGAVISIGSAPGAPDYRAIFVVTAALFAATAGLGAWRLPPDEPAGSPEPSAAKVQPAR
ncbi:MAG TPA: MFS transporter [Trueperaceae bacterium]|jgi:DHA1 family multidrug resistance protein-like MFS transporter